MLVACVERTADDDLVAPVVTALEHHCIVALNRHADLTFARDRVAHAGLALRFTLRIGALLRDLLVAAGALAEEAAVVVAVVVVEAASRPSRGASGRGRRGFA